MCGRYTLFQTGELAERFGLEQSEIDRLLGHELRPRYNISPSQSLPVIYMKEDDSIHVEPMRWGYIPTWAKDARSVFRYKTFNARSEEIFEKRTWKDAVRRRRCLVPASGFYEWTGTGTGKQPYFIRPAQAGLFAFAGIWGSWKDAEGNAWHTYSILTTEANDEMQAIHHRMPLIMEPEDEKRWLDTGRTEPEKVADILQPYRGDLEIYPVSRRVNTSRVDEDTLVHPINSK